MNNSAWKRISMNNVSFEYSATIPGNETPAGTEIIYFIEATDIFGNSANSTIKSLLSLAFNPIKITNMQYDKVILNDSLNVNCTVVSMTKEGEINAGEPITWVGLYYGLIDEDFSYINMTKYPGSNIIWNASIPFDLIQSEAIIEIYVNATTSTYQNDNVLNSKYIECPLRCRKTPCT